MNFCLQLVVIVWQLVDAVRDDENGTCHGWTRPVVENNDTVSCLCGKTKDKAILSECSNTLQVLSCIGITYDNDSGQLLAGPTPYSCNFFGTVRIGLTCNLSAIGYTKYFCDRWQREGLMCSRCKPNHGVPLYSYSYSCVICEPHWYGWLKYIAIAYLPLTVFYLLLAFFRISVNSGTWNVFVMVSQIIASRSQIRQALNTLDTSSKFTVMFSIGSVVFGIWNLDFFRYNYPSFCVSSEWTELDTIVLDYLIGIYPILLIFLTYCAVKLHDRFFFLAYLWSPFRKCLSIFYKQQGSRDSVIEYFATFLLLSYVKILNVSFDLLLTVNLYNVNETVVKNVLYYDASTSAFNGNHILFGILAVVMLIVFNVLPLIMLLIYPCRCFQKVLNRLNYRAQGLHIFMDSFQGCFSHTGHDYRYFAAVLLLIRFITLALFSFSLYTLYYFTTSLLLITCGAFILGLRPYKKKVENFSNALLLIACGFSYASVPIYVQTTQLSYNFVRVPLWFGLGMMVFIILHGIIALIYTFCPCLFNKLKPKPHNREMVDSILPHRFEHMGSTDYKTACPK